MTPGTYLHQPRFAKDSPNMVKFNPDYQESIRLNGRPVGRYLSPALGEYLHGLPHNWTDARVAVAFQHPEGHVLRTASMCLP